jgi:hypothetical protein
MARFRHYDVEVAYGQYGNGRLAVTLLDAHDAGPVLTATVNLPEQPLEADEVYIKDWSENEGMLKFLQEHGIVVPTIKEVPTGYVTAHRCKVLRMGS